MKVRLSDAMVRFRLDREEVEDLSRGEPVYLSLPVEPTSLTIRLEPIAGVRATADYRDGLRIGIPSGWLPGWVDSETVGFDFEVETSLPTSEASMLRIVVEKDFPCAHDGEGPPKPVRMS
jgi:hypothetical protein